MYAFPTHPHTANSGTGRRLRGWIVLTLAAALLSAAAMGAFASAQDPATEVVAKGGNWEIFANGDMEWNNEPIAEGYARLLVIPTLRTWDQKVPPKITKLEGHDGAYVGDSMATLLNINNTTDGMCPDDFSGLDANIDFCIREAPTARDTKQVRILNMDGTLNRIETHIKRFQFRPLALLDLMADPKERVIVTLKDGAASPATDDEIRLELILLNTKKPTVSLEVPDDGRSVEEGEPVVFHLKLESPMRTALNDVMYYVCHDSSNYFVGRRCGFETATIPAGGDGMVEVTVPTVEQNCNNTSKYRAEVIGFSISGSNYAGGGGSMARVAVTNKTGSSGNPDVIIYNWPTGRAIVEGQRAYFLAQTTCRLYFGHAEYDQFSMRRFVEDAPGSDFIKAAGEGDAQLDIGTFRGSTQSRGTLIIVETEDDAMDEPDGVITVHLRLAASGPNIGTATIMVRDND